MKIAEFIEKHFWILLLAGILLGLWQPVPFRIPQFLPKLILMLMLFFVFLKIDALEVLENMRNYKMMLSIATIYMIIVPVILFFLFNIFNRELALGILLLTAMPAAVSSPALTDILKGNVSLSMSLAIITQLVAPFTVTMLFWIIGANTLQINEWLVFKDIVILVFLPMIVSQMIKRFFADAVNRNLHLFTSINVFILFVFVYIVMSSQRDAIIARPASLVWKTAILYLVFVILHIIGYLSGYGQKRENKIALAIGSAYMNNGLAIVLASSYFSTDILILMVLSEFPWNTLLAPFKKLVAYLPSKQG